MVLARCVVVFVLLFAVLVQCIVAVGGHGDCRLQTSFGGDRRCHVHPLFAVQGDCPALRVNDHVQRRGEVGCVPVSPNWKICVVVVLGLAVVVSLNMQLVVVP